MPDSMTEAARATGSSALRTEPLCCWRLSADAALRLHYWDGECVLFHGAAGDTHRLPELVGRLIERLATAPAAVAELSEAIDLHAEDVLLSLVELERLGIVETDR